MNKKVEIQAKTKKKSLRTNALAWATRAPLYACLDSLQTNSEGSALDMQSNELIIAVRFDQKTLDISSLLHLRHYIEQNSQHGWLFGYLSYDLKNEIEELGSNNADIMGVQSIRFFEADLVFKIKGGDIELCFSRQPGLTVALLRKQIVETEINLHPEIQVNLQARISKRDYINDIEKIKYHIKRGDIYEANYCREYFAEDVKIDPLSTYLELSDRSPAPFSAFAKFAEHHVISASPERFLKKVGNTVMSQPIKGTSRSSRDPYENEKLKKQLTNSEKDRSENIMIVDLVRNDLSKIAIKKSVKVNELCAIYSFTHLHHLISTVSCLVNKDVNPIDIITACFPMGSMTGVPKVRAMELIEDLEHNRRGLYSGSIGYIEPNNDFDFNVVIRSIFYNEDKLAVSTISGGAITIDSEPASEYEESLLKLRAIFDTLNVSNEVLLNEH